MNVSRRRYMGEKGGSSPYQRIEYLGSTGTQYIDTGIKASGNLAIKINLVDYFTSEHFGQWAFGGRNGYKDKCFGYYILNNGYGDTCFSYGNTEVFDLWYSRFPASSILEIGGGVLKIGDHTKSYSIQTFTSDYNLILFGLQYGGTALPMSAKIGNTYITNGTITRDFIPVRIGQVGYMYDTVSGELFGNAGTGDFVLGPDVTDE